VTSANPADTRAFNGSAKNEGPDLSLVLPLF
jgi:hypothetical protein